MKCNAGDAKPVLSIRNGLDDNGSAKRIKKTRKSNKIVESTRRLI